MLRSRGRVGSLMPVMQDSVSVAANARSTNQLAGLLYEYLSNPSAIRIFTTGSAAGLRCSLLIGGRTIVDDVAINTQNRSPLIPDDFLAEDGGFAGERLTLIFRNTTAGALTAFWRVEVIPVG